MWQILEIKFQMPKIHYDLSFDLGPKITQNRMRSISIQEVNSVSKFLENDSVNGGRAVSSVSLFSPVWGTAVNAQMIRR